MKLTYLNHSATTPTDLKVLSSMEEYFTTKFGNASEPHFLGREASLAIQKSRIQVADLINAKPEEIVFTSCATESINISHKGLVEGILRKYSDQKKVHIITSQVEHKAVLETCKHLENLNLAYVTYLPVDQYGMINIDDLKKEINKDTALVSLMYVNNEVGTIQPIKEIGELIKKENDKRVNTFPIYFHTDATQAVQYLNCDVDYLGVDLLSLTGHKIYAPKGIGALYIRKKTPVIKQIDGGRQEFNLRGGTENVPYIVGLGKAVEIVGNIRDKESKRLEKLRDKLIVGVLNIEGIKLTGHSKVRAPHIASFIIDGAEGESIVLFLADKKIIASTGSACNSSDLQQSHVLKAMGIKPEDSHGSLRFSLGRNTTIDEIDVVLKELPKVVSKLRKMAPNLSI